MYALQSSSGGDFLQPSEVAQVVELLDVAARDRVPVARGDARLKVEREAGEALGVAGGLGSDAGEGEHARDVGAVLLADLGELLLAVVGLVWQADATLHHEEDVARGVAGVVVDEHAVEAAEALALELCGEAHEFGDRGNGERALKVGADRLGAERVDALGVHEARVERGDLVGLRVGAALDEAGGRGFGARDDVADCLFGVLGEDGEGSVAGLVGGDLGAVDPLSVHVPKQIVLWAHRRVEFGEINTGVAHVHSLAAGDRGAQGVHSQRSHGFVAVRVVWSSCLEQLGSREIGGPSESRRAIDRRIAALAIPALGALIVEPLLLTLDAIFIGHLGAAPLAGLAIASAILQTAVGLMIFLAYSTTPMVARRRGCWGSARRGPGRNRRAVARARDRRRCWRVRCGYSAPRSCARSGLSAETTAQALAYLTVSCLGIPAMLLVFAATGLLRGLQDTRTPLYVATIGFSANALLNWWFIYGLGWGIAGSAWGTVVAQWGMVVVYVSVIAGTRGRRSASWLPQRDGLSQAGRSGGWLFIRTLGLRAAFLATVFAATSHGTEATAAYQVVFTHLLDCGVRARRARDRRAGAHR